MNTLLPFLFVLGVLIFVHELGHFWMARRLGVRVLTFSLGFGPKILNIRRGDTDYCVSIIPLGGYVKMAGDSPEEARSGHDDEFLSKSKWERFQILIMGPVMNILLALVVTAVVLFQGVEVPAYVDEPPVVGAVQAGSPAEQVGVLPGDRIVTVGGDAVETWDDLSIAIGMRPDRAVPMTLDRGGESVSVTVTPNPETRFEIGTIGVFPDTYPVIRTVTPGDPADRAGFQVGDLILAVDGERIVLSSDLAAATSRSAGIPLDITIRRDGREQTIQVTPAQQGDRGMIGIATAQLTRSFQPGPFEAIALSAQQTLDGSMLIFKTIGQLLSGEASPRQMMGPVAIAQLSGESAQAGWVALFALMSMISLNLGVLNLLPIPVLDGGHILILMLEGIARRDFSMRVKERVFMAGFVVLMTLMVTVLYNDLTRVAWIEQLMPWRN